MLTKRAPRADIAAAEESEKVDGVDRHAAVVGEQNGFERGFTGGEIEREWVVAAATGAAWIHRRRRAVFQPGRPVGHEQGAPLHQSAVHQKRQRIGLGEGRGRRGAQPGQPEGLDARQEGRELRAQTMHRLSLPQSTRGDAA